MTIPIMGLTPATYAIKVHKIQLTATTALVVAGRSMARRWRTHSGLSQMAIT
jgi:hypothetical protein